MTHYEILELDENASSQQIRAAYLRLALKYHPDKVQQNQTSLQEANLNFKKLQAAYEILSDPEKRACYDSSLLRNQFNPSDEVYEHNYSHFQQGFWSQNSEKEEASNALFTDQWFVDSRSNDQRILLSRPSIRQNFMPHIRYSVMAQSIAFPYTRGDKMSDQLYRSLLSIIPYDTSWGTGLDVELSLNLPGCKNQIIAIMGLIAEHFELPDDLANMVQSRMLGLEPISYESEVEEQRHSFHIH